MTWKVLEYMKRLSPKANRWEDHYSRLAKKENYPARSVYKLQELQSRYKLIKKGGRVLDLGCYPGSWTIYASDLVGQKGTVVGIDLKKLDIKIPSNALVYQCDILNIDNSMLLSIGNKFDIVISDMAPATTGNKSVDAVRSYDLCLAALDVANNVLLHNGSFLCKIFQGEDFNKFLEMVKAAFNTYKIFKPQSSRKLSKEIYIIGLGKK
uniref:Ribosomal RNA large subunit methyltransferase E n=2 Tax=Desulfobacterium TaxID=2295 RepID=E1YIH9_9BACT|nr:Ribosomal RNA large subunit methyltransferase J [uncultured Desulfobacterium sp.]